MITGRPLFPGSTVEDELHLIFRILGETPVESRWAFAFSDTYVLSTHVNWLTELSVSSTGTPTEETWPGITTSEEFKTYNFPQYKAEPLVNHAPRCVILICDLNIGADLGTGLFMGSMKKKDDYSMQTLLSC